MEVKYVAMDVHFATTTAVVLDTDGKRLIKTVFQTKDNLVRDFLRGLAGTIYLTFEEGTLAQWLYEIAEPLVARVVVCNPRHNRLLKEGSKSDSIDADRLAELFRCGSLRPVYHRRHEVGELKELVAIYEQLTQDRTRVINRLRAVFRSESLVVEIRGKRNREAAVKELGTAGKKQRATLLFQELDEVTRLQSEARREMIREARTHKAYRRLQTAPGIRAIRAALLLAWAVTPHRFRTKRQFWKYCGLSLVSRTSSDYGLKEGSIIRRQQETGTRGLVRNYNRGLKNLFKGAALDALKDKQARPYYERLLERGLKASVARVQLARKLAASCLAIWKSGKEFDYERLNSRIGQIG